MCPENTVKLCECGCGEPAAIATMTSRARGVVAGQPLRFKHGHNGRGTPAERVERFWARVDKTDRCWLWTARIDKTTGYGRLDVCGRGLLAHRVAYEMVIGPVPQGLTLDHLCRVRHCVNPQHLEPVTRGENVLRGVGWAGLHARKTHCPRGHLYDEENTYVVPATGHRQCRACKRMRRADVRRLVG